MNAHIIHSCYMSLASHNIDINQVNVHSCLQIVHTSCHSQPVLQYPCTDLSLSLSLSLIIQIPFTAAASSIARIHTNPLANPQRLVPCPRCILSTQHINPRHIPLSSTLRRRTPPTTPHSRRADRQRTIIPTTPHSRCRCGGRRSRHRNVLG